MMGAEQPSPHPLNDSSYPTDGQPTLEECAISSDTREAGNDTEDVTLEVDRTAPTAHDRKYRSDSSDKSKVIDSSCTIGCRQPRTYRSLKLDDDVPAISVSAVLNLPSTRPKRKTRRRPMDEHPTIAYGDPIIQKQENSTRFSFQNSKGLTYPTTGEDYGYYLSCLQAFKVDIFGIAETNPCWTHLHLTADFRRQARRFYRQNRIAFSSPSREIDPCGERATFQAGGTITAATWRSVSYSIGDTLTDPTGLGRWSGLTFQGKSQTKLSIITAYRSCTGSVKTSGALGSTYIRECEYYKQKGIKSPNPRMLLLDDLRDYISQLRNENEDHAIIFMMDANSVLATDEKFKEFLIQQELFDLHDRAPAPSTYIGAKDRRIEYIFGTERIGHGISRAGTLAYNEGPQSDHRGLYVDVDLSVIFDPFCEPPTFQSLEKRSLHSGNPEHVEHYNSQMKAYCNHHRMYDCMKALSENFATMDREELRESLESGMRIRGGP